MVDKLDQRWFAKTFLHQMAEIQGEMARVLKDKKKLEIIRTNYKYKGEPQIIQHVFNVIKKDPKNIPLRREIDLAEKETFAFLTGEKDAPSEQYMTEYWQKYLQAYMVEIEQKDKRYD